MRVLIAEDDPVSRRVLQSTLLKMGYEVEVACDGKEAWEALQGEDAPRLAVLDWMMPYMDGPSICRELRNRNSGPYVYTILLTAKAQRDDMISGLESGADDYLVKPFDSSELTVRLRAGKRVLDLQAELISAREAVRAQAVRDPLTGLPNRLLFADRLSTRLCQAERSKQTVGVMFLDLDHFKVINDSLGHNVGDHLLKEVACRLQSCLRDGDTLARMGGDEFTIILGSSLKPEDPSVVASRLLASLSEPFIIEGRELFVTGSVGISEFPRDGSDVETLVRNADAAMYRAKEQGRNAYRWFTEELSERAMERVSVESALRRALKRNEFALHYQMRVDLQTGLAPGVEALIRWNHPEMGMLSPADFIPVAEEINLMGPISEWVIESACKQNKAWQDAGFLRMDVAVNISPRLLTQIDLVGCVKTALSHSGLEPRYLTLELTETAVMQNTSNALQVMADLKGVGINLCIDDFGTGYSSLSLLKRLPIDALKIDASFVRHVTTSKDDRSIATAIVAMAHTMNLKVVAEGVETVDQLRLLKDLGCDEIQGYFISRPVPPDELVHLLAEGRPPLANWTALAA